MEGSADQALVNHYYFYRAVLGASYDPELTQEKAEELISAAPIEAIYPDAGKSGVAWNVTGGGILSNSPNPEAARAVLAILLSDAGQQAYAWTNREYPVVEGVPAAPGVQPPDSFSWSDASLVELAAQNGAAIALIQELGLE